MIRPKKLPIALFCAIAVGLNGLFFTLYFNTTSISVWIPILTFIFLIAVVLLLFVQQAEFIISPKGIRQHVQPRLRWWSLNGTEIDRFYPWYRLNSFVEAERANRNRGKRRFLKLRMDDGYMINIDEGDISGAEDYDTFLKAFYSYTGLKRNDPDNKALNATAKVRDMYDYSRVYINNRPSTSAQHRSPGTNMFQTTLGLTIGGLILALSIVALTTFI